MYKTVHVFDRYMYHSCLDQLYLGLYTFKAGWLCLTSHRQRGHLETAPPFTVPCEGREAR